MRNKKQIDEDLKNLHKVLVKRYVRAQGLQECVLCSHPTVLTKFNRDVWFHQCSNECCQYKWLEVE